MPIAIGANEVDGPAIQARLAGIPDSIGVEVVELVACLGGVEDTTAPFLKTIIGRIGIAVPCKKHDIIPAFTIKQGLGNQNPVVALAAAGVGSEVHLYVGVLVAIEVINQYCITTRERSRWSALGVG